MSNYHRAIIPGGVYFFTVVTRDRARIFINEDRVNALRLAFRKVMAVRPFVHTYAKLTIGSFAAGFLLHRGWFRRELAPKARAFLSTG